MKIKFKNGDEVTIKGVGGVYTVRCKVNRFCLSLSRSSYKILLSNGKEYWDTELRHYVKPQVIWKAY